MKNDKQQSFLERKVDMSKKMVLLAAAILIAMVGSASANLITNGSFEDPALSNGSWGPMLALKFETMWPELQKMAIILSN
jgi:hypothetical protein